MPDKKVYQGTGDGKPVDEKAARAGEPVEVAVVEDTADDTGAATDVAETPAAPAAAAEEDASPNAEGAGADSIAAETPEPVDATAVAVPVNFVDAPQAEDASGRRTEKPGGDHMGRGQEKGAEKIKKPVIIAIIVAVVALIAVLAGVGISNALEAENRANIEYYQDHIFDRTSVGGVDVSKMTAEEAAEAVNEAVAGMSATVSDEGEETTFTASEAKVSEVPESFFEKIVEGQDPEQWKDGCSENTAIDMPELVYDLGALEKSVAKMDCVSGTSRKDAVDAELHMDKGEFEVIPGKEGDRVDADTLTDLVLSGITGGVYDADGSGSERDSAYADQVAAVTKAKDDLKKLRTSFTDEDKDGWDDNTDVIIADAIAEGQAKVDAEQAKLDQMKEGGSGSLGTYDGKTVKLDGIHVDGAANAQPISAADHYEQPVWTGDEPEFAAAQEKAEKWLGAEIDYTIDMLPHAEKVDRTVIEDFIIINQDNIDVEFDEDAVKAWLHEIGQKYDTVGTTRTYTSPTGEVHELSGGHYGWTTDESAELPLLEDDIMNGRKVSRDISYEREAKGPKGGQEWGDFYVDVDRYDQIARVVKNGEVIYSWDFVSGTNTPARETQIGFYDVFWKASPHIMKGDIDPRTGKPEYETPCTYFICFIHNGSAVHDADSIRSNWSKSAWLNGNGSHGCLNTHYSDAQWVYNNIDYGTPFIVHD